MRTLTLSIVAALSVSGVAFADSSMRNTDQATVLGNQQMIKENRARLSGNHTESPRERQIHDGERQQMGSRASDNRMARAQSAVSHSSYMSAHGIGLQRSRR